MSTSFILLCISLFTWGIGEGMFFVFQPIYLAQLGANTMTIAMVYSAFGAAMMIAHVPAGYLADRFGRKPLLLAAWTSGLIATWVMALAKTLPVFIVGMLLYGLTAFVSSPLNSYITADRGKLTPARAMTLSSAMFSLGAVFGPLTGGWLGEQLGLRTVYFIAAGLFVVSEAILFFLRSQPKESHDPNAPAPSLLRNNVFFGWLGIFFLIMFTTYLPQPLTARFLEDERNLSLGAIGLLGSVNWLGNTVFNLFLGQFSSGIGLILVQISVAVFSLLIWRGTGMEWYAAGYFILGGYRSVRAFIFSTVRSLIHPSQMGLAFGVAETVNSLAVVLAPMLTGVLYSRSSELVYPASLGLIGLSTLITLFLYRRQKKYEQGNKHVVMEK